MLFANGFIPFLTLSTLTLMNLSITHLDYPVLLDAYPTLKHEVISLQVLTARETDRKIGVISYDRKQYYIN